MTATIIIIIIRFPFTTEGNCVRHWFISHDDFQQLIVCFTGSIVLLLNGHIYRHFARIGQFVESFSDFETEIADRQTIQINNSCVNVRDYANQKKKKIFCAGQKSSLGEPANASAHKSEINGERKKRKSVMCCADNRVQEWKDYWTDNDIPMGQHIFIHLRFSQSLPHCTKLRFRLSQWQPHYVRAFFRIKLLLFFVEQLT